VPDFEGIARESYRRGEQGESVSDMYGNVAGQALLAAAPAVVGRVGRAAGPKIVANAERSYAGITEPPLKESMARQMMDRGISGGADKIASDAAKAKQAATTTKEALIRDNPMPERYRSTPARQDVMRQVRTAAEEEQFQADVQVIAESIQKPARSGNILTGKVGKALELVPGVTTVVKAAEYGKALYELPKSTAFKTSTALAQDRFGQAMMAGDHALAAEIGAGIATGAFAVDDFGHRNAIQSLAQEADAVSPELRRQVVGTKRGYYTDPDGHEVEIPRNVMSALMDAPRVDETVSPVAMWLDSMSKQGKLKKGGKTRFQ